MDSSDDAEQPATKITKVTSKVQLSAAPSVPTLVSQPTSVSAGSLQSSYSSAAVAPAETSQPLQPASALSSTTAEGDTDQPVSSLLAAYVEPLPLASVSSPVVPDRLARTANGNRMGCFMLFYFVYFSK